MIRKAGIFLTVIALAAGSGSLLAQTLNSALRGSTPLNEEGPAAPMTPMRNTAEKDVVGGGFAGPGLDYALSSNSAVEVRARYHLVSDVSGVHTDFLETQAGVRFFF